MAWLLNASGETLRTFLTDHVGQGATVITDGWRSYGHACHVSSNTARTIVHRNRQLLELVDRQKTGRRGGSWARYRLRPEGLCELRRRVAELDERGLTRSLVAAAPSAALISAKDILLERFAAAADPGFGVGSMDQLTPFHVSARETSSAVVPLVSS
jgi:hypothetical protein